MNHKKNIFACLCAVILITIFSGCSQEQNVEVNIVNVIETEESIITEVAESNEISQNSTISYGNIIIAKNNNGVIIGGNNYGSIINNNSNSSSINVNINGNQNIVSGNNSSINVNVNGNQNVVGGNNSVTINEQVILDNFPPSFTGYKTITFSNGNTYSGYLVNDKFHGEGIMTYSDGDWEDGKFEYGNFMSGKVLYIFDDGSWYEGGWNDGKRHGHGIYVYYDGGWEEGEFRNGIFWNGKGVYIYSGSATGITVINGILN